MVHTSGYPDLTASPELHALVDPARVVCACVVRGACEYEGKESTREKRVRERREYEREESTKEETVQNSNPDTSSSASSPSCLSYTQKLITNVHFRAGATAMTGLTWARDR